MVSKRWPLKVWFVIGLLSCIGLLAFTGCADDPPPTVQGDAAIEKPSGDSSTRRDTRRLDDTSTFDDSGVAAPSLTWSVVDPGTDEWLYGIWGSASDDVWAVGWGTIAEGPTILHFDGSTWALDEGVPTGKTHVLRAVWGTAKDNVWAVGLNGAIFHFTGSSWKDIDSGTEEHLYGLWGSSANDIWAVGANGIIVRFNGTKWAPVHSNKEAIFSTVWGSSSSDIWAAGDTTPPIIHYDGSSWSDGEYEENAAFEQIWGFSKEDVWIVGWASRIFRYTNNKWSPVDSGLSDPTRLSGIWGTSSNDVWIAGEPGILHCRAESSTVKCTTATIPEKIEFRAIWGSSANDIWAVGETHQGSDKVMMHGVEK